MSMSRKKCCVPGCMDSGTSHKTMHLFPNPNKDLERFNQWVFSIGGDIIGLQNEDIYKHRSVCHSHFEEKYCCRFNRLSNIAVPTLNLPGPLSLPRFTHEERRPLREIQHSQPTTSSQGFLMESLTLHVDQASIKENTGHSSPLKSYAEGPLGQIQDSAPVTSSQGPLSLPRLTHEERRPLREIQHSQPTTSSQGHLSPLKSYAEGPLGQIQDSAPVTSSQDSQKNKGGMRIGKTVRKHVRINQEEHNLYQKLIQTRIKLSKCRNKIKKQAASLKAAKKIVSNPALLATMEKLPSTAKLLILMQFREIKKKHKGRRFTLGEKMLALSIFKQAPRSYRFLRKILILPAPQTLSKLISQANINPGINKNIFKQIKNVTEKMKPEERLCIVMFDEMNLKEVVGFATDGKETRPDFADHAQVFMVRGLIKNYKQPVSYTFSARSTSGQQIVKEIKQVITELQEAGLIVVATVCDQGSNNRQAIKLLLQETEGIYLRKGEEPKNNVFLINGHQVVPLYDPPHLLKCVRNNLLTKDLEYTQNGVKQTAKWDHLKLLHKENPGYKGLRLIPKLTDNHVMPEKAKMKVKLASQIFSRTVATNMGYLAEKGLLPKECKETADVLLFFDNLFDSHNGSNSKKKQKFAKPLLGQVTPTSVHHREWLESKNILKTMKFVTKSGKTEKVPTLSNWMWTLDGLEVLLKNLEKHYNITSVYMRHLNQDPIENFFGAVRSHGCRDNSPTPEKFESAFTTLLINNLSSVHTPSGKNCEEDHCKSLQSLIITDCETTATSDTTDYFVPNIELLDDPVNNDDPRGTGLLNYISGYFAKKTQTNVFKSCQKCKTDIISVDRHDYIKYREFSGRQWLCSPTDAVVKCITDIQNVSNAILKENLEKQNLREMIKTHILMFTDFDFLKCQDHKNNNIDYFLKITTRFYIHNYCKNLNKILCGKRMYNEHDENDNMQRKAQMYFKKCFKRSINK